MFISFRVTTALRLIHNRTSALPHWIAISSNFVFFWDGTPMHLQIGGSSCYVRSPVNHIYLLLGELNTVAELPIMTNARNMQRRGQCICNAN